MSMLISNWNDYELLDTSNGEKLMKENSSKVFGKPMPTTVVGGIPLFIFPYNHEKNGELLLAYMLVYDEYYYEIQFYSNKTIDGKDERYLNYDYLFKIANSLNKRVKIK